MNETPASGVTLESLGQYTLLERIGAGGIGETWRARDSRSGQTVALKVVGAHITNDPGARTRFLADARVAASLSHPGLAAIHEVGEAGPAVYLASDFVQGETLARVVGGRPLNARRAVGIAAQVADALAEAHAVGVVYGDLKPANVIVTSKGTVKILDVGLGAWSSGRAARDRAATSDTVDAVSAMTTVAYMSPEQTFGCAVDHRSDVFSLGSVLFEMLTGRPPFAPAPSSDLPVLIAQAPAPVPSRTNDAVPVELDGLIARMLAKSFDARADSMAALAAELRAVDSTLSARYAERADDEREMFAQSPTRSWVGWTVAAAVVAAMVALIWLALRVR